MKLLPLLCARIASFFRDIRSELSAEDCSPDTIPDRRDRSGSTNPKDILGVQGEKLAQRRLLVRGYAVLETNIVLDGCEIDLIAEQRGTIVFVEVKTRRNRDFDADPADAVDSLRRSRMIRAARAYRRWRQLENAPVRFDIIAIIWPKNGSPQIDHRIAAFGE